MKKTTIDWKQLKAVAIDLDGVVYFGNKVVPGTSVAVESFRKAGLKVFFITNNSGRNREEITTKINNMGIRCSLDEVITSGYATALFVQKLKPKQPVLVIGSDSLKEEFKKAGLLVIDKDNCKILVVGLDQNYRYDKIAAGMEAVRCGAKFIACNIDANFPIEGGKYLPGCGAMVAAIEAAADKKADYIIGKPNTFMLQLIAKTHKMRPKEILVIGDGVDSDISMAEKFGSPTILITTKHSFGILTARSLCQTAKLVTKQRKGAEKK